MVSDLVSNLIRDAQINKSYLKGDTNLSPGEMDEAAKSIVDKDFLSNLTLSEATIPDALKGAYDPLAAFELAYVAMRNNMTATLTDMFTTLIAEGPNIEAYSPFSGAVGPWRNRKDDSAAAFREIILACEAANVETSSAFITLSQQLRQIGNQLQTLQGLPTNLTPQLTETYKRITEFQGISSSKEFDKQFTLKPRENDLGFIAREPGIGGIGGGAASPLAKLRDIESATTHSKSVRMLYWRQVIGVFDVLKLTLEALEYCLELGYTLTDTVVTPGTPFIPGTLARPPSWYARVPLIGRLGRGSPAIPATPATPAVSATTMKGMVTNSELATDTLVVNVVNILSSMGTAYGTNTANAINALTLPPPSVDETTLQERIQYVEAVINQLSVMYGGSPGIS